MTKNQLKEMIREELGKMNNEPSVNENDLSAYTNLAADAIPILATILGVGGTLAAAFYKDLKGKSKEEKEAILKQISGQIEKSKGQGGSTY
jgi:tRNA A22 N-methylase